MIINRLPYLMEQKKVSIRQLSRRTGITYTTIRAIYHSERRSVQLEVLDAICQVLDIQPGDIYVRATENQAAPTEPAVLKLPEDERATKTTMDQSDGGESRETDKAALELGKGRKIDDWKSW